MKNKKLPWGMKINRGVLKLFKRIVFLLWIFSISDIAMSETVNPPIPDIKANGSNGPITIDTNDTLTVNVSLSDGSNAGANADWWVVADTPFGLYHYGVGSNTWTPGLIVTNQGPLFNLSPFEILNSSGLTIGTYTVYFGVDMNMNDSLYRNQLYYDSVVVIVTETLSSPWPMFHYNAQHTGQSPFNGPQTNNLKWKYTCDGITEGNMFGSISIDSNSTIYVTAADRLLALNSDGELEWSADLAGTGATAISPDGTTVYAAGGTNLYAFTTSGEALWTYNEPSDNIYGEPCIASDGTIYFGSWDTYVYALNPNGTLKWEYQTDGAIAPLASPTLSNDETTIYVGSGDPNKDDGGTLYAINATGTLKGKIENLDPMRVSGAVVGPNDRVYVCASNRVQCFSPAGKKIWESEEDTASNLTPSLSLDGIIYVGTGPDGKVYAIDSSNGKTRWSYQTGTNPEPIGPQYGVLATIVIGADGTVYAGAIDGVMHALTSDGRVRWTYQTGANINENCPAIGPDGTLYFSSADKYLYAIKDQ